MLGPQQPVAMAVVMSALVEALPADPRRLALEFGELPV